MFVILLSYRCEPEEVDKHLEAHVDYLKEEYTRGSFLASGRKVPRTGGVILSKMRDRMALESILARDPFHLAGIADYEIIEFMPSMVAQGYENLKG